MKSFTLALQILGIALIAPSWGLPQHTLKRFKGLVKPQQGPYVAVDSDYVFTPTVTSTERPLRIIAAEKIPTETREEFLARKRFQEEELRHQAESAKYSFSSHLSDRIMDGEHNRAETREGLKTTGSYTYSDGFVRRTVEYVADENGYRVIKQTEEPIGNGPQPDPTGSADVSAYYDRSKLEYSITADDIRGHYSDEEEEEEEEITKSPLIAAFARASSVPVPKPAPAPVPVRASVSGSVPVPIPTAQVPVVPNDFNTQQNLRPAERHEIQTPLRPLPTLRGQYFTQVHAL